MLRPKPPRPTPAAHPQPHLPSPEHKATGAAGPPPAVSLTHCLPSGLRVGFLRLAAVPASDPQPFYSGAGQPAPPERDSALGTGRGAPRTASVSAGGAPSGCGRRHFIIRERGQSAASPNRRRAPADAVPTTSLPPTPPMSLHPPVGGSEGAGGVPVPMHSPVRRPRGGFFWGG